MFTNKLKSVSDRWLYLLTYNNWLITRWLCGFWIVYCMGNNSRCFLFQVRTSRNPGLEHHGWLLCAFEFQVSNQSWCLEHLPTMRSDIKWLYEPKAGVSIVSCTTGNIFQCFSCLTSTWVCLQNGSYLMCNPSQLRSSWNGPLTRYGKLQVAHAPGMPGTFPPAANFKGNR